MSEHLLSAISNKQQEATAMTDTNLCRHLTYGQKENILVGGKTVHIFLNYLSRGLEKGVGAIGVMPFPLTNLFPSFSVNILAADRSREYINRLQIHECRNWERGSAVSFLGIHKSGSSIVQRKHRPRDVSSKNFRSRIHRTGTHTVVMASHWILT